MRRRRIGTMRKATKIAPISEVPAVVQTLERSGIISDRASHGGCTPDNDLDGEVWNWDAWDESVERAEDGPLLLSPIPDRIGGLPVPESLHLEFTCTDAEKKKARSLLLQRQLGGGSKVLTTVVLLLILTGMLLGFVVRVQREVAAAYRPYAYAATRRIAPREAPAVRSSTAVQTVNLRLQLQFRDCLDRTIASWFTRGFLAGMTVLLLGAWLSAAANPRRTPSIPGCGCSSCS